MRFESKQRIYILAETGALGDTIATFPTIKQLVDRGNIEKIFVADKYLFLYRNLFPSNLIIPHSKALGTIPKDQVPKGTPEHYLNKDGTGVCLSYPVIEGIPIIQTMIEGKLNPIHCSLVDAFSVRICDTILKDSQKDYPKIPRKKLPTNICPADKYAVVGLGATAAHKRMTPESFRAIKGYLASVGLQTVLLGARSHQTMVGATGDLLRPDFEGYDFTGCVDMIDKSPLDSSLAILSDAKCFIGIDGGMLHLAGLTDIPIVAGHTFIDPYYLTIYRNGQKGWRYYAVEPDSHCRYCTSETFILTGLKFHRCNIGTNDCALSLTPDKWLHKIELALSF